jgi:hypothetical protein
MVDAELLRELEAAAANLGGITRLPEQDADKFVRDLSAVFMTNGTSRWWWESLRTPINCIAYGSEDGTSILLDLIKTETCAVLVVTEDADPPLALYEGKPDALISVIRECRFFEYALAARDASWIVFDTHMNELLVAGVLVS